MAEPDPAAPAAAEAEAAPAPPPRPPPPVGEAGPAPSDAAVEAMFAKLLQLQLLPGDAQQRLIATLSIDKKQQMISMHGALLADDAAASKSRFTAGEDGALLQLIRDADAASARAARARSAAR